MNKRWTKKRLKAGREWSALALVWFALLLTSCGGGNNKNAVKDFDADDEDAATQNANIKKNVKPEPDAEAAVIETDVGRIVIELYPNIAPQMVTRFKQLAKEGFYNNTTFHRVNPELGIIQGGDPNSKDNDPANDGQGSSPLPDVPAEFSDLPYERGTVGAARSASINSANCQFFITLKRQPAFDQRYTIFGRVIEGLNTADVISNAPVETGTERPSDKFLIRSITLQPRASFPNAKP